VFEDFEGDSISLRSRIVVAADASSMSRLRGAFALIAGSTAQLRTRRFRIVTDEKNNKWRVAGFPDCSSSLNEMFGLPAPRTTDALRAFITRRYPRWHLSDEISRRC